MHETSCIFNSTEVEYLGIPSEKTWRKWRTSIPIHKEPSEIKNWGLVQWILCPWKCGNSFHPKCPTSNMRHPPPLLVPYLWEPNIPFKDTSIETTEFGITQEIPTREEKYHRSDAIGQGSNNWLNTFPVLPSGEDVGCLV